MIDKPTGNLKKLIELCNDNIKGLINRENIQTLLPIEFKTLMINEDGNKLVIKYDNQTIKHVWIDTNCYSSLEILKTIARNIWYRV